MKYQNFEFHVLRSRFTPYGWYYQVQDGNQNYESATQYKTQQEAVKAVFTCMEILIEQKIEKDNTLPKLN